MREQKDLGTPQSLRKLLKHYLEMFMKNCREMGFDAKKAEAVKFAMVALIDETVLSIPGECCDFWNARSLQFEYYGEQIAGDKFYQDLHDLMADAHDNYETLETFYYCLSLGFQGKYLDDAEERERVIRGLARVLINTRKQVRPHPKTPAVIPVKPLVSLILPTWLVISITAALVLAIWFGTSIATRSFSQKTIRSLETGYTTMTD